MEIIIQYNIGQIGVHYIPILGANGLHIFVGNDIDPLLLPGKTRYASNCNVTIDDGCVFCGTTLFLADDCSYIKIGKYCMFSWGIDVWCTDVHTLTDLDGNPINYGKSIDIGNHVWV